MDNFYSIDRLMEFGLGMAMAQQMVRVMNDSMKDMYVPGSAATIPAAGASSHQIYVAIDNNPAGPFSDKEFKELVAAGKVNKDTLVWQPGQNGWQTVEKVPDILKIIALTPPPLPKM